MKKQRKHYTPEEKGRHPEAASAGEGTHLKALQWSGTPADCLLPLAEGILRERGRSLPERLPRCWPSCCCKTQGAMPGSIRRAIS